MIARYMEAAMRRATFYQLDEGTFVGEIPGFDSVGA